MLLVVLLLMNLLIAMLTDQQKNFHMRSGKYWCFVQLETIANQRRSYVRGLANWIEQRFDYGDGSQNDADELKALSKRVDERMGQDRHHLCAKKSEEPTPQTPSSARRKQDASRRRSSDGFRSRRNSNSISIAPNSLEPEEDDEKALERGLKRITEKCERDSSRKEACLLLCEQLLDRTTLGHSAQHLDTWLVEHVAKLYPEVGYFDGQDLKERPGSDNSQANAASLERDCVRSARLVAGLVRSGCLKFKNPREYGSSSTYGSPLAVFFFEKPVVLQEATPCAFICDNLLGPVVEQLCDEPSDTEHDSRRPRNLDALLVALACQEVGKIKAFADDVVFETQLESVDHDVIVQNALMHCPALLPSYERLTPDRQSCVCRALSAHFNLGQFLQAECVHADLLPLERLVDGGTGSECALLRFVLLLWIARVPAFTEIKIIFDAVKDACNTLFKLERGANVKDVYCDWLCLYAKSKLNMSRPEFDCQMHLVRLAMFLRFSEKADFDRLRGAWEKLDPEQQKNLQKELNTTGVDTKPKWAIKIYYGPDLLRNIDALRPRPRPRPDTTDGITLGLVTLNNLFLETRHRLERHQGNGVYTLSVLSLALHAKKEGMSLEDFDHTSGFQLEHMGDEGLVNLKDAGPTTAR